MKLETMRKQVIGAEDYTNLHDMVGNIVKVVFNDNTEINKRLDN